MDKVEKLNDYEKYELFNNIVEGYERSNRLSIEDGEYIDSLMSNPNTTVAIHRTDLGPIDIVDGVPNESNVNSIMTDGLINNGHAMQGAYRENPSLSLTTTPLETFGDLINFFSSYKNNNVTVILEFPKELVAEDLSFKGNPAQIYNKEDTIHYIKPEYIKGIIIKGTDQDKFYKREDILKQNKKTS